MSDKTPVATEEGLRALFRCPAFYGFGGKVELPLQQKLIRRVFEAMTYDALKGDTVTKREFPKYVNKSIKYVYDVRALTDAEVMKITREAYIKLDQLWRPLVHSNAFPVLPPRLMRSVVKGQPVDFTISAIYRATAGPSHRYIAYVFSPYRKRLDMLNDPVVSLQAQAIHDFILDALDSSNSWIRLIGTDPTEANIENVQTKHFTREHQERVGNAVSTLFTLSSFNPRVPCPKPSSCSKQALCIPVSNR